MANRHFAVALICCVAILGLAASAGAEKPGIFSTKKFDEAKDEAKAAGKLFVADATAVWCPPCKKMDKTTWIDEKVTAWMKEHAIAAQFDVDAEKDLSTKLNISAMPTIIVFKEGTEFDRTVGYKTPEELIAWLEGAMKGNREIDKLRKAAGDRAGKDGHVDVQARLRLAETLSRTGEFEEATREFIWLWDNMLKYDEAMVGVRGSFMVSDMQQLAAKNEPAKKEFIKLRDRYQPAIDDGSASPEAAGDWLDLNKVVGEEDATLKWFDRIKDDPMQQDVLDRVDYELVELFMSHDRWADVGKMVHDPVTKAKSHAEMLHMPGSDRISKEQRDQMEESMRTMVRDQVSKLYAGCLAANREKEAGGVAEVLLKELDDSQSRFALVKLAVKAGQPREQHVKWLDEADAKGDKNDALRKKLEGALAKKSAKDKPAS